MTLQERSSSLDVDVSARQPDCGQPPPPDAPCHILDDVQRPDEVGVTMEVLARIRSEMQRRGFSDYYPAMAVWPFAPGTNPPRGQSRRTLMVALAKEGQIILLDHDKRPIDARQFQWNVSRRPDDQVFIAASDLEALVDGLLDAPKAEETRRQAEEARRQAEEARRQAERQRRGDELRRLRFIPPDARRLIRRTPKLDRKSVAMLLHSGLNAEAILDAVALLGKKLPGNFDSIVNDWQIRQAKRLYKESGFVPPGMGKFATSLTSEQRSRQHRKANADKITEWASQRPRTTAELREHLEEFLALDVPRLGRRQQIVAERLEQLGKQKTAPPAEEQPRRRWTSGEGKCCVSSPMKRTWLAGLPLTPRMQRHWSTPTGITAKFRVFIGASIAK